MWWLSVHLALIISCCVAGKMFSQFNRETLNKDVQCRFSATLIHEQA
jgi:hypothetical protein